MTPLKFAGDEYVFWREATQMYSVRTGLLRMSLKPELLEKRKSDRDMTPPLKFAGDEFVFWREAIQM